MSVSLTGPQGECSPESLAYVCQMLAELRQVAHREGADMLCYLIEMAYVEAGELRSACRPRSNVRIERDETS